MEQQDTADEQSIRWHNAFCAATELELADNADVLDFHREYILGKEPIKIDLLVIRVKDNAILKNEIAKGFFRGHNVMEYKSPGDEVNIDTLYKLIAYAALYKAETGKDVDAVKDYDITMTIVRENKPVKLLRILDKKACNITVRYKGIYQVSDLIFPLQIIVAKELDEESHIWLKSLTRNLTEQSAKKLSYKYRTVQETGTKEEQQNAEMVMELVAHASNIELVKDIREDGIMTIMDVAGPVIEAERRKTEAERRKTEAERRKTEAERETGIQNMAELFFRFHQPQTVAKEAIMEKYPTVGENYIDEIITKIYDN